MVELSGGVVVGLGFVIELEELAGRGKLEATTPSFAQCSHIFHYRHKPFPNSQEEVIMSQQRRGEILAGRVENSGRSVLHKCQPWFESLVAMGSGFIAIVLAWIGIGSVVLPLVGCAFLQETNVFGLSCSDGAITGEHSLGRIVVGGSGFLIGLLGLWAVVRLIHKKPLARVVTGRSKYHRCLYGMLVALAVSLLIFLTNRFILGLEMTFQEPLGICAFPAIVPHSEWL